MPRQINVYNTPFDPRMAEAIAPLDMKIPPCPSEHTSRYADRGGLSSTCLYCGWYAVYGDPRQTKVGEPVSDEQMSRLRLLAEGNL